MRVAPTDTESETGGGVSVTVQDLWRGDSIQVYPAGSGSGPDVVAFWPGPGTWKAEIRLTSGTTAGEVELFYILPESILPAQPEQSVPIGEITTASATNDLNLRFTVDSIRPLTDVGFLRSADGQWRTDLDWIGPELAFSLDRTQVTFRGQTYTVTYVLPDHAGSSDSNSGSTPAAAKKTATTALRDNVRRYIVLQSGYYFTGVQGWDSGPQDADKIVVSSVAGVPAYLTADLKTTADPVWTGDGTDTWYTTGAEWFVDAGAFIVDFGYWTDYGFSELDSDRPLLVPFLTEASTVPVRTYIKNVGGTDRLYYKSPAGHTPNGAKTKIMGVDTKNSKTLFGTSLWCKDVEFWGGNSAFTIDYDYVETPETPLKNNAEPDAMFFDCAFRFSQKPIVYCLGESYVVLKRCDVTDSTEDGIDARIRAVVLEDSCTVGYVGINGVADRRFVQCSTGHIGARMIRVGGEYKFSGGPLIQDVMYDDDLFSYGLILGSHLHQSLGQTSPSFRRYAIAVGSAELDFSELWTIEPRFASRFGSVSADTKYCRLDEDATSWQCVSPPSWSVAIVSGGTATFKAIPNFAGLVFSKDVFPSLLPLAGESL